MNKKTLIIFAIISLLIIVIYSNNDSINNDNLFENRLKCDSLKDKIEEKAIDKTSNSAFIENNGEGNFWIYYTLDDVFYSPQRQSCLYIIKMEHSKESLLKEMYQLSDYFTKSHIDNCNYGKNDKDDYRIKEFWQTVKELKEAK